MFCICRSPLSVQLDDVLQFNCTNDMSTVVVVVSVLHGPKVARDDSK